MSNSMNSDMLDIIVAEELAACDRMLQKLTDDYNSIERVKLRQKLSEMIGREFCSETEV